MLSFKPSSNIQPSHMPLGESRERKKEKYSVELNVWHVLFDVLLRICVCTYLFSMLNFVFAYK